jgi:sugar transferase (PEP-CTERM/EpsH1 system associated)
MAHKPGLLFLTQRIPYPPDKGEKIRYWPLLNHLHDHYDIHLGCLIDDPRDVGHIDTVRALCADAYFAKIDPKRAKIACMRGLLTGDPLSVSYFRNRGLAAWVARVVREVKPSAILVCSSNMAPYVLDLDAGDAVRLVDLVDVDSEKWRSYAATAGWPMRWVYRREWRKTAELEARIARESDWCALVSSTEARLFTQILPQAAAWTRAVPNGVDHAYFDPTQVFAAPFDTTPPNYVFTGTMDYKPNIDAVIWFAQEVLPLIHRTRPDAQFHIVGANPVPEVRKLALRTAVFVTGRVADVRPYVAHATAAVAPLRIARGIQNKVLEAMAMARPVVVTPWALEGIDAEPGHDVLMAEDAEAFAAACLATLEPQNLAIGAAARRRIVADYTWSERLRGFDTLLDPSQQRDKAR